MLEFSGARTFVQSGYRIGTFHLHQLLIFSPINLCVGLHMHKHTDL